MSAALVDLPTETPGTPVSCADCPALQQMERELGALRREVSELRCEGGYWKSRHADAVKRIEQLKDELHQSQGQVRSLQDKLFGRKSERSASGDRSNELFDPEEAATTAKKRGARPGHTGHPRRDYSHLPVTEEFVPLPAESLVCPRCDKPAAMMSDSEDSTVLEIEVRPHRRRIRRRRYRAACDCDPARRTLVAPPAPKLIPKGNYGVSIWTLVLLDKYASYRPTERLLGQLKQYGLDLPAGTINDGLQRIEPLLQPIYAALLQRNRQGDFHQADETRWLVFALLDGKKGYVWWLWVVLGVDTVVYLLDSSRSHEVPESHFGPQAWGVLEVDRYSAYKAMAQVKSGRIVLAFCWAHVRRDFVGVGKSWTELTPWALRWLRRIRYVYRVHRERLRHRPGSAKFQEQEALLRRAVEAMRMDAVAELSEAKLRQPCRKVLESLQEHWTGLVRFVEDPRIPPDNNAAERAGRGPAVARKNFYGSGSLWSGRLAATMFSLLATLAHWKINPRSWLTWYLESCAAAGGKPPADIQPFLPWNLSDERRLALGASIPVPSAHNTS
ncbi:MAG: IS66 family transposase [Thermoguttaceae bacterium]|nr:IS66 family transposase [Thermoguttaceae bacterium]